MPLGTLATTATMVTMATMVINHTMATMATMYLSTTPLTMPPTTPHHHLTTLLAVSLELQAALAQMDLADLDLEASAKEVLVQLVLAQ